MKRPAFPVEGSAAGIKQGLSGEVLAVPTAFDETIGALRACAQAANLTADTTRRGSGNRLRFAEVTIWRGPGIVVRWRVREVAQLRRAAIVIDDLGEDLEAAHKLLRQNYPLTFSVLPDLRHSAETAREAHLAGREVMLHLPMEPLPAPGVNPGPGEIKVGMDGDKVAEIISLDLASVPFAVGVNNHMGSRATADAALMREVMKVIAQRRLFFVDSRTTAETVALKEARRAGLRSFYRSVFLDDTETVAYTLQQLRLFHRAIEEQGMALAIGHPHPTTLAALTQYLPEFDRNDIQLVPVSKLVELPESARLEPGGSSGKWHVASGT